MATREGVGAAVAGALVSWEITSVVEESKAIAAADGRCLWSV